MNNGIRNRKARKLSHIYLLQVLFTGCSLIFLISPGQPSYKILAREYYFSWSQALINHEPKMTNFVKMERSFSKGVNMARLVLN